ncbi:twin-arginine translocase TatA/TatE family subunit [Streptomyces sp. NPDC101118]|uniref:twin-arginine translocase TatA/TatE family subunit n=1 Tax=Streptomyces sp. NPDC101118 TaxID=3366109 RepID=UPI00381B407F
MIRNALEPWHLALLLLVCLLVFGSKKLPDMAPGLGRSLRILKAETQALRSDLPDAPSRNSPHAAGEETGR